jgi:uncharacterized membrane protein
LKAGYFLALMLGGYFGILLLLPLWYGWLAPPSVLSPRVALIVLGLPLFAALRGLLHGRSYTVAWSLFLSVIYFTHGVVEAYSSPDARWLALAEVLLSLCWLVGGILYVRTAQTGTA